MPLGNLLDVCLQPVAYKEVIAMASVEKYFNNIFYISFSSSNAMVAHNRYCIIVLNAKIFSVFFWWGIYFYSQIVQYSYPLMMTDDAESAP
jgi:hypothetical protein